jgi:hypothetical protein
MLGLSAGIWVFVAAAKPSPLNIVAAVGMSVAFLFSLGGRK